MKAPCSPAWVSPRRGEGPGTQSILQGRDFEAEGLEQWKVLLKVAGQLIENQDSDSVCLLENPHPHSPVYGQQII